jgi:Arc/MetJ family transcription regulator
MRSTNERRHTEVIRRTSINLDFDLVTQAGEILRTNGTTDTVHRALEDVIRRDALKRLAEWDLGGMTLEDLERMRQPTHFLDEDE